MTGFIQNFSPNMSISGVLKFLVVFGLGKFSGASPDKVRETVATSLAFYNPMNSIGAKYYLPAPQLVNRVSVVDNTIESTTFKHLPEDQQKKIFRMKKICNMLISRADNGILGVPLSLGQRENLFGTSSYVSYTELREEFNSLYESAISAY